jgi:hypothetical protein
MTQYTQGPWAPHYRGFMIIFRPITFGRTPLSKRSARRREGYLKTHNIQKRKTSKLLAGFDPTIHLNKWQQTHVFDRIATRIGSGVC